MDPSVIDVSPAPNHKTLDRRVIQGLAWTGGVKWCSQIVSWATTLFVARLLAPADYGLVGMATIYLGLVSLFSEFGVGTAVITLGELNEEKLAQLHTVSLILGVPWLLDIMCSGYSTRFVLP